MGEAMKAAEVMAKQYGRAVPAQEGRRPLGDMPVVQGVPVAYGAAKQAYYLLPLPRRF